MPDTASKHLLILLALPSAIHLHGSASRAPWDGWAEDVLETNQYKDYYYPNTQAARTLWYHGKFALFQIICLADEYLDHAVMIT